MILQALLEGGWNNAEEKEESNKSDVMSDEDGDNVIAGLGSLSKKEEKKEAKDENDVVQSALKSQNVSVIAKSCLTTRHRRIVSRHTVRIFYSHVSEETCPTILLTFYVYYNRLLMQKSNWLTR